MRKITIDPRVIQHLGCNLITSSEVAVMELVKNSIDAKAKEIELRVYTHILLQDLPDVSGISPLLSAYLEKPAFLVKDTGCGMTDNVIDHGFLTVGTSNKEEMENTLGKKGIGRLATQRLGKALLIETFSTEEEHTSYVFVEWDKLINGDTEVPSFEGPKTEEGTRLWIFDIQIDDYIENAIQLQQMSMANMGVTIQPVLNRNLKTALNFIISPFESHNSKPKIGFFLDNDSVDIAFPDDMLKLAESIHQFDFKPTDKSLLSCTMEIKPWFAERVHRAIVKPEAFKRLKKSHDFYNELLERNKKRIENVLSDYISRDVLLDKITKSLSRYYALEDSPEKEKAFENFVCEKAIAIVDHLITISPIKGKVYSFKQGPGIGDNIVIESANALHSTKEQHSISDFRHFLEDYNGIKLYRHIYRIGYLGNKESDWIKLQQYRTKGQQWYRFDLGNTVGFVSLTDPSQEKIQEISSRLDISENEVSEAFKILINIVFNSLFYELNRNANDIIKVLLSEEGLLCEDIKKRVKKNNTHLQEMIRRNARMQKALQDATYHIGQARKIDGSEQVALPEKSFDSLVNTLKTLDEDIKADSSAQEKTAALLSEADTQLKAIEIESYNNYKLMANGIITETITHELHPISVEDVSSEMDKHFNALEDYFVENKKVSIYNGHVVPIQDSFTYITNKLGEIGVLYSFLETTFIRKGTIDEFVNQDIKTVVVGIEKNLKETVQKENIPIICKTDNLSWIVPKGVLLHVFYNLINNSLYWIDVRRKWAQKDPFFLSDEDDKIQINAYGENKIVVSDTGTGVSKKMEDILFEPLQSGKPYSEGRGMGLYIVKKLMNSFGGDITLMDDRNQYGNRYRFLLTYNTSEE